MTRSSFLSDPRAAGRRIARLGLLAATALSILVLPACATILGGGKLQRVGFASTPAGATVTVDGRSVGTTPATISLARKEAAVVEISLPGYQTHEVLLDKSINGWFWANILLGGLIGMAVDAVSGSMYKLSPEQIEAQLVAAGATDVRLEEDGLYVFVTLTPAADWTSIGQLWREQ